MTQLQTYLDKLKPNVILRGPLFPEPVQVITAYPLGDAVKLIATGVQTNQTHQPILSLSQLAALDFSPETEPFDGDARHFRLGIEARRLALAYEYDPYFSLSIARIDPLPHQLEAVYDYFMKLPRIRFLLADDPGAGKTIMAGLLLEELNARLEDRRRELQQERHCTIADIQPVGRAWVLPHPDRHTPGLAPMVRDDEIERIAVEAVTAHEESEGRQVQSVEKENKGFDLIARRYHPEDPATAVEVRFIEVKGRAGVGEVALSSNEYKTALQLGDDYWLYVVFNCATEPQIQIIRNPARLNWQPIVKVEHYHLPPKDILGATG